MKHLLKNVPAKKILFFLLFFTATLLILYSLKKIYTVKDVEVRGGEVRGISDLSGRPLFLISEDIVKNNLILQNPEIKTASVRKIYPSKIVIEVQKETPIAVLKATDGYFYLTSSKRVLYKRRVHQEGYPIIRSFERVHFASYSIGEYISTKDIQYSLFFIEKMKDLGIKIDKVDILGFDMLVLNEFEKSYIISVSRDYKLQYSQLKQIVNHLAIEGKEYKTLDLRFEKPIIKLK